MSTTHSLQEIIQTVSDLASMPEVCFKLNELAEDSYASVQDFNAVIKTDPALASKLLKVANSAFYGYGSNIDDLHRAVGIIGTVGLRDIAWASIAIERFNSLSNDFVDMDTFWSHSLYTATVAKVLANKCRVVNKDRLFLYGLLHDIGHLALYQLEVDAMQQVFDLASKNEEQVFVAERTVLGFTHCEVGEGLLELWNLPENLCQAVANHHQPGMAKEFRLDAAIVHLADTIAKIAGNRGIKGNSPNKFDVNAWKITGLSEKIVDSVIQVANEQFKDVIQLYLPSSSFHSAA